MNKQDNDFDQFMKRNASRKERPDSHNAAGDEAFLSEFDSEYEVAAVVRSAQRTELARPGSPDEIPESMPVLRAFHEFLDQERRRARRRMIILACSLSAAFLLLFLIGAVLLIQHQNQLATHYNKMAEELLSLRQETVRPQPPADSTRAAPDAKADSLKDMLIMSQQALINAQAKLDAQATAQSREMNSLRDTIDRLSQNTPGVRLPAENEPLRSPPPPPPPPRDATAGTSIAVPITPEGTDQPLTWRTVLPE